MSIIYCEKHDRRWDSDRLDMCPVCENEPVDEVSEREEFIEWWAAQSTGLGEVYRFTVWNAWLAGITAAHKACKREKALVEVARYILEDCSRHSNDTDTAYAEALKGVLAAYEKEKGNE